MDFFTKENSTYVAVGLGIGFFIGWSLKGKLSSITLSARGGLHETAFASDRGEFKLVLVVRNDLKISKGNAAAQCCHATVSAYETVSKTDPDMLRRWRIYGGNKVVLKTDTEESLLKIAREARSAGLNASVIKDASGTQTARGTITAAGIGPGPAKLVNQITGHLKLY